MPHPKRTQSQFSRRLGACRRPHTNSVQDLVKVYPEQFDKLGNFSGEAKLAVKHNVEPIIDAPRKCPIHITDQLKQEINEPVNQGVIRKVNEHIDRCSSLAFSTKNDGSMRICFDPQRLNNSLERCPSTIPTVEELNPQ